MFFLHIVQTSGFSPSHNRFIITVYQHSPKKSSVNFHSTFIFKAEIQTKYKTTDVKVYEL